MRYDHEKGCYLFPVSVNISVTEKCSLRCPYCFQDYSQASELDPLIIYSYLDQLAFLGTRHVQFSGGEPILYEPLLDVISYAKNKGFTTRIATSGVGMNTTLARQLKQVGLDYCHVSLNGSSAQIHEITRNCFDETMAAIELLAQEQIPLVINWVAYHSNIQDLPNIINLAKKYGVIYISVLVNKRNHSKVLIDPLTAEDITILRRIHKENSDYLRMESCFDEFLSDWPGKSIDCGCRAGRFYMAISAQNEFSPCPHAIKSKSEGSILKYWYEDEKLNRMRKELKNRNADEGKDIPYLAPCMKLVE